MRRRATATHARKRTAPAVRCVLSWLTRPREDAVRDSLAAIDTIETLRGGCKRMAEAAPTSLGINIDYYWLSGRLLQDDGRGRGGASPSPSPSACVRARSSMRSESRSEPVPSIRYIRRWGRATHRTRRHRRRATRAHGPDTRQPATGDTPARARRRLERREQDATAQHRAGVPRSQGTWHARLPASTAIQAALAPDEALLSFQVGLWETYAGENGGGSWLIAVTTTRPGRSHRLPDRMRLSHGMPMFIGLLAGARRSRDSGGRRFYEELV